MKQENSIRDLIIKYEDDICYLQQMQIYSMSAYEKNYYSEQIKKTTKAIISELDNIMQLEQKYILRSPEESNFIIRHKLEENGSVEDYQYNVGNEFIISPQLNTQHEFFISPEQEAEDDFINILEGNEDIYYINNDEPIMEREFTLEELAEYNGTNGKPAYVAINGIVYDMSNIGPWSGETHFGLFAGNNLTDQFMGCHRGAQSVLGKLCPVGKLVQ